MLFQDAGPKRKSSPEYMEESDDCLTLFMVVELRNAAYKRVSRLDYADGYYEPAAALFEFTFHHNGSLQPLILPFSL
jgi:hypothetical protein